MNALPSSVVVASHNSGKFRELQILLRGVGVEARSAAELALGEPVEDGDSYVANACIKADAALAACGLPCLADDTGVAVVALDGKPGIHTGRYAQAEGGWDAARLSIKRACGLEPGGRPCPATLDCALALARPGLATRSVFASVPGRLVWPPREGLPGLSAMFEPSQGVLLEAGVLLHRRQAFAELLKVLAISS